MREVLIIIMMLVVLMWAALPLYWGSLAPGLSHAPNFKTWVVDFDGGPLGAFVAESIINSTKIGNRHLDWEVKPASQFSSIQDVANQVVAEKAWAAVTINPGASSTLYIARAYGDYTYDQTKAVTLYVEQARSENAVGQLIAPIATELLDKTLRDFNARDIAAYIRAIRTHPDAVETSLESPSALAGAWWKTVNLRPWNAAVASPMTIIGQIYLTLFAFIITVTSHRARQKLESLLTYKSLVALRIGLPLAAYIPLSTSYAMLGLFFRAPFDAKFHSGGGFFIYVAYTYMDICALGLVCEAAMSILRPDHMTLFLVSWLVVNISTPIEPPEMQSRWYRYAYGMPFYNHAVAVRTILFDTKNLLGRNAGVLFAWIGLSMIAISFLVWLKHKITAKNDQLRGLAYDVDRPQEVIWSTEHV
ncbi:nitrosoguanidine resistance protein SNG1, putative [Rhizoctonia solani AG-3 Rhs1AP]|nr:nitrosoguanidine resistance protein SNG1, putative [Rhizoctonia solani AG-3 Rhs1AP]